MVTTSTVYANAAWPVLIIMGGLRTWHAIVIGLLIEAAVIFIVVKLNPMQSIVKLPTAISDADYFYSKGGETVYENLQGLLFKCQNSSNHRGK